MSANASIAFSEVRPHCVEFIKTQNIESVKKLHNTLLEIHKDALDEISQYVLFPFRVLLKKNDRRKEGVLIEACQCLDYIFKCSTINDWSVVHEFLTLLCAAITDPMDKSFAACGSEELKKSVIGAIGVLLGHTCYPVWNNVYHYKMIPMLGHLVTLLLSVIKSNVARDARIAACQTLKSLCQPQYCELLEESQQVLSAITIGNCMACFLPGISSCLARVISNDTTAGNRVKCACLNLLATSITATLGDKTLMGSGESGVKLPVDDDADSKLASLRVKRDEKWVGSVAEKLGPVIVSASSASDSDSWSLRLSCVQFCGGILLDCSSSLKSCSNTLLKIPVKLLNDEYGQISERCAKILEEFSSKLQEDESRSRILVEILEENLFVLCTNLPRMMRRDPDKNKLSTLKILLGYLTLLKEKLNGLLYSAPHMKKLSTALLHCLELDTTSLHIIEQVTPGDGPADSLAGSPGQGHDHYFRKNFAHFRDGHIYDVLKSICRVMGEYGDLDLVVDHFQEVYTTSESNCRQAVIIIGEILVGATRAERKKLQPTVKSILDEILSPENWYLITSYDSDCLKTFHQNRMQKVGVSSLMPANPSSMFNEDFTLKSLKSNIILCCLQLEAICTLSKVLGNEFRPYLMDALYPLLEKTTDSDTTISECARNVVHGVAFNCGYKSPRELIADNADYLISTISIQLHHLEMFPRCPAVLQAMLDHSNADMLVIVSDTVDEILTSLDLHHLDPSNLLVFLPVLSSVTNAVKRWVADDTKNGSDKAELSATPSAAEFSDDVSAKTRKDNKNQVKISARDVGTAPDDVTKERKSAEELRDFLLEIQKNQKIVAMELEAEVDPDWEPGKEEDALQEELDVPDEKKEIPLEIKVTTKVLSRCIHLMAHADPRVQMKVMDVVANGMDVLKAAENELLPMAHKLWSPLMARFGDKELQVVARAFDMLCVMGAHSKDFLRKRFCKDILPKLLSVLETQGRNSIRLSSKTPTTQSAVRIAIHGDRTNRDSNSIAYMHTTACKLQRKALHGLGPLLMDIDITRKDHISVCKSCIAYLSMRQPQQLQDAALVLFKHLIRIDCDLTWLKLSGVWCPEQVLHPPDHMKGKPMGHNLKAVHLGGSSDRNNEFAKNIEKLLEIC